MNLRPSFKVYAATCLPPVLRHLPGHSRGIETGPDGRPRMICADKTRRALDDDDGAQIRTEARRAGNLSGVAQSNYPAGLAMMGEWDDVLHRWDQGVVEDTRRHLQGAKMTRYLQVSGWEVEKRGALTISRRRERSVVNRLGYNQAAFSPTRSHRARVRSRIKKETLATV